MGVIRCQDEILEQVRRDTGLSITEVQVERVLNGKSCSISEEAKNIILTYGRQYVKRIVSASWRLVSICRQFQLYFWEGEQDFLNAT